MPKGEHLKGNPGRAGWREKIIDEVGRTNVGTGKNTRKSQMYLPTEWLRLTKIAAATRNISVSGYMRRAVMAFVIHDLGMNHDKVMDAEPGLRAGGNMGTDLEFAHGRGHGEWKIGELHE